MVEGASNVGSLELVLVYDPSVLEVTGVERGTLVGDALMVSSMDTPGQVWIGMIDASGISGDGAVAVVTFNVLGTPGSTSSLDLKEIAAHDADTLLALITETIAGGYSVSDGALEPPTIRFVP